MSPSSAALEEYPVLAPDLQISFATQLRIVRKNYLAPALREAIGKLAIPEIDAQLAEFVGPERLRALAVYGLRGEVFYPVPLILKTKPMLVGYYRLLYGFSRKEFYRVDSPFKGLQPMEDDRLSAQNEARLPAVCRSLVETGWLLFNGVQPVDQDLIDDLQLLLVGAQLRGAQNNRIGQGATRSVFELVRGLVAHRLLDTSSDRVLLLTNAAGRTVKIAFAADPDMSIEELLPSGSVPSVSIEIKGGSDASNVHNRIGEAEKSHLKAKDADYTRFWTISQVRIDLAIARRASPTTTDFFFLEDILDATNPVHAKFRDLLYQAVGIA